MISIKNLLKQAPVFVLTLAKLVSDKFKFRPLMFAANFRFFLNYEKTSVRQVDPFLLFKPSRKLCWWTDLTEMLHKAGLYCQKKHRPHPFRLYSPFQDGCRKSYYYKVLDLFILNEIYVSGERGIIS